MERIAKFTIEDPTRQAKLKDRGLHFLFISVISACITLFSLFFMTMFAQLPGILLVFLIVSIVCSIITVVLLKMCVNKERKFVDKTKRFVEGEVVSGLSSTSLPENEEVFDWISSSCLSHLGGAAPTDDCTFVQNIAYIARYEKDDDGNLVCEVFSGKIDANCQIA